MAFAQCSIFYAYSNVKESFLFLLTSARNLRNSAKPTLFHPTGRRSIDTTHVNSPTGVDRCYITRCPLCLVLYIEYFNLFILNEREPL